MASHCRTKEVREGRSFTSNTFAIALGQVVRRAALERKILRRQYSMPAFAGGFFKQSPNSLVADILQIDRVESLAPQGIVLHTSGEAMVAAIVLAPIQNAESSSMLRTWEYVVRRNDPYPEDGLRFRPYPTDLPTAG